MSYDLADIDTIKASNEGVDFEIKHPTTNGPTGIFFTILGKDSDTFREFQRHKFNEYLRAEAYAKARGKQPQAKSAEDYEDDMLTLLVACTTGWFFRETPDSPKMPFLFGGKEMAFTAENLRAVYKARPFVRDQINDAVGDLANFIKA